MTLSVLIGGQRYTHSEDVRRIEPQMNTREMVKAFEHQARAYQQNQAQRNLQRYERSV
jgi:hypothetical protein